MPLRRARNLQEYEAITGFMTENSLQRGLSYRPDPSDIFISPYAKCGTTWMQQIVHGLRSGGDMDFSEITEVVPWLEMARDMGTDPDAPQSAAPRAFKSHLRWDQIPKGGRYITVLRDPVDAMVSLFSFLEGWWFEPGSISLEEFAGSYLREGPEGYWAHAASWWGARSESTVLLLCFEDLKEDLAACVNRVADFIDPDYTSERRAIAIRQAEFDFMRAHGDQFDDHLLRAARDAACGLPPDGAATKVHQGKIGKTVTPQIRAALDAEWQSTLGAEFGLPSYAALRRELARLHVSFC